MTTTPMSVQDSLWLTMDRPNNLMVVDGAMVLRGGLDLAEVTEVMLAVCDRHPVFRRRAVADGLGWAWADDDGFDIAEHVLQVDRDGWATMADLQAFVGEQRSVPLDADRPLWVAYLLPRLRLSDGEDGCAVVMRFHHAIADGVRVTQLMLSTCQTAEGTVVPLVARSGAGDGPFDPVAAVTGGVQEAVRVTTSAARAAAGAAVDAATGAAGAAGAAAESAGQAAGAAISDPVGTLASLPATLASLPADAAGALTAAVTGLVRGGAEGVEDGLAVVRRPDRLLDALEVLGVDDHRLLNDLASVAKLAFTDSGRAVWTGVPGEDKVVSWSPPMPLADVKAIGRATGSTVNDVMVSAVAGAMRVYLAGRNDSLDEVVWMVPVNLKPFEDNLPEDLGNYFALVMLPMSLGEASHEERLADTHHRMARIKHSDEAVLTFGLQRTVSMSPSAVATFLTDFFANKAVGVLTNVPGPTKPMTFAGAPVEQIVGFAPCSGNQSLTVTIFSYAGTVTVGFGTDASLVPDPDRLTDLVVAELAEMSAALVDD